MQLFWKVYNFFSLFAIVKFLLVIIRSEKTCSSLIILDSKLSFIHGLSGAKFVTKKPLWGLCEKIQK
jgi:hypothetical protein